jgi:hypothetical protein
MGCKIFVSLMVRIQIIIVKNLHQKNIKTSFFGNGNIKKIGQNQNRKFNHLHGKIEIVYQ